MNMEVSDTAYRNLKTVERIPLLLQAAARRDDVEVKRLMDTMPRHELVDAPSPKHTAWIRTVESTAGYVAMELYTHLGKLRRSREIQSLLAEQAWQSMSKRQQRQIEAVADAPLDEGALQRATRVRLDESVNHLFRVSDQIDRLADGSLEVLSGVLFGYDQMLIALANTNAYVVLRAFYPDLHHELERLQITSVLGDPSAAAAIERRTRQIWTEAMSQFT
jgi:hypothetical protein